MSVSEIQLYNILREKVGEVQAQSLVDFIQTSVKDEFSAKKDLFATKEDLANVKVDIIRWLVATNIALAGVIIAVVKLL